MRTIVRHGGAGCVIGHRGGVDERKRERLEPTNGHRVARPDCENDLARQMRGKLDLCSIVQDQPVDVAARRQRVLLDRASGRRKLRRIPQGIRGLRVDGGS